MSKYLFSSLLSLFVFLFIQQSALGQQFKEEYKKATITLKSGEKIDGFIEQDELPKLMCRIRVKKI